MRKIIFALVCVFLFVQFVSADAQILINQNPSELYSLGDAIQIPVKVATLSDTKGYFSIYLICGGRQEEVYKNGVNLLAGGEVMFDPVILLTQSEIGKLSGTCKLKAMLGEDFVLTEDFKISNKIELVVSSGEEEFDPGAEVVIDGEAIKENGEAVEGFVELIVEGIETNSSYLETISNGFFSINFVLPKDAGAGEYSLKLRAYEIDFIGETTNEGSVNHKISVAQVPTSLEIVFENEQIEPGTDLKVKAVLHDQTGEKIEAVADIIIKDEQTRVRKQSEQTTDEFLEFPIVYSEPAAEWIVIVVSESIENQASFEIVEKKEVKVELTNKTVTLTNVGNIPYNDSVLVNIGEDSLYIDVYLEINESKKYVLSAPDGEYQVEIITDEGSKISGMATLTGDVINVKEASGGVFSLIKYPIVWFFMLAVLGFIAFMIYKKGYKRSFFGYIGSKRKGEGMKGIIQKKSYLVDSKNRAELSLSIKGDKQNVGVVCLKLKNFKDVSKGSAKESLQKVVDMAESKKAFTYENQDNIFFILAPVKTKTFKNEKVVIEIAQGVEEILKAHNKLAKQKIEFGLSLNHGTIIAKQENDVLQFMSLGALIALAKKVASVSNGEIFLSGKFKDNLETDVRTQKLNKNGVEVYIIKEIKNRDQHKKFLDSFVKRLNDDKKK
ncbi:hypothetical protein ACFL0X_00030 [Nanoarchaeota archaeon]